MRSRDAEDEAISESHKCMDLTPVDGSSVVFFSSEPEQSFPALPHLFC